jgi:hypothetical protein
MIRLERVTLSLFAAAAVLVAPGLTSAVAYADPSDDDPGYVIDDGGQPGVEHLPRVCQSDPIACNLRYQPGPGTWVRPDPEPLH